jgi:hypothetical protein
MITTTLSKQLKSLFQKQILTIKTFKTFFMTNKIRKMLAKNYVQQAKKNRIKALVLTAITALCTIALFYAGVNEKRLWYLGTMAILFISAIYTIVALIKTKPESLAKSKDVLAIINRIFEHNREMLLHSIGKALTGVAKDPGLLCSVATEMPKPDEYKYYARLTYNVNDNDHTNAYFINELYIQLRDNDFYIYCKIAYKNKSTADATTGTTIINVEKDIRCIIPLLEQHFPADLKELATI